MLRRCDSPGAGSSVAPDAGVATGSTSRGAREHESETKTAATIVAAVHFDGAGIGILDRMPAIY